MLHLNMDRKLERKKGKRTHRLLQCFLIGACVTGIVLFHGKAVVCMAAGAGKADSEKTDSEKNGSGTTVSNGESAAEIETFVTSFYEAHTKEGMDSLKDYIEGEESLEAYLRRLEIYFTYGVIKYDNIDVLVYPLQEGDYWLTVVSNDLIVGEDNMALPGARTELVYKGKDGRLAIFMDDKGISDVPEELSEEIRQILVTDEIVERMMEQDAKFKDICEEYPEVIEWGNDLSNALWAMQTGNTTYESEEDDDIYTVQKGDCLWYIAEKELGDGMRWSEIYKNNRDVIGDDPDLLYVGIRLLLDK